MVSRILVTLCGGLALGACEQGVDVTIASKEKGSLLVAVASSSNDFHACIDQASIFAASADEASPAWEAGRTNPRDCAQQVSVGPDTPGFKQRTSAPLKPATRYCVEVRGPGFAERHGFILRNGMVVESPASEANAAC